MQLRSSVFFILLNVFLSLAVAAGAILFYNSRQSPAETRNVPTIIIVVTATPDPNQPLAADQLQGTMDAQAGTMVAMGRALNDAEAALALAQAEGETEGITALIPTRPPQGSGQGRGDAALPTIPPELIPALPTLSAGQVELAQTLDDGCQRYYVQAGDTASTIAVRFSVSLSALLVLNGLTDQSILRIGDELLIPSAGCEPQIPPTTTPIPQPTFNLSVASATPAASPTPSGGSQSGAGIGQSQIEIVRVANPGDVTTEQVEIRNTGAELNLLGWTLSDEDDNRYTFPDVRMVQGGVIRISTRSGTNTPGFLFWGLNQSIWRNGEVVTLRDAAGDVQAVANVGGGRVIEFPTPSN